MNTLDVATIRDEFPLLHQEVNGVPLVYLDNAATTQKPLSVIESITDYYTGYNSNIHRGVHHLANLATTAFENTRHAVRELISAEHVHEIIFTSGTTESINIVAQCYGEIAVSAGDEILVSHMEHHSNIVPWQMLAERKGAILKVIPVTEKGEWDWAALDSLLSEKTKIVAVSHVSNALGTINPVKQLIDKAHAVGAKVLIDGAQAVAHLAVHVEYLDADFYCFSAHKMYGPTGVGVLYGKEALLNAMPPYKGGGEMIQTVSFSGTTYNTLPHKFEAGTPNIEGIIALHAAIKFIKDLGWEALESHEQLLLTKATKELSEIEGLKIYGTSAHKVAVISFLVEGIHPYDLGTLLDKQGIAVRTGHHCTQPLWERFGIPGTVRASFSIYNTEEEIEALTHALKRAITMLR
ncbi:MAG: aminotransferase class V-fold PLP-dependent enzyme [Flavobacteriales bacterium]|jgi:cysteine desulfurase/selenocysteine lyase